MMPGGTAEKAGIQLGDRLVEIDGQRVIGSAEAVTEQLSGEDRPHAVTLERDGAVITLRLRAAQKLETVHRVVSLAQITPMQQLVRDGWLKRETVRSSAP
jgi:C-terminal processing protease CtpA/Prc